MVATTIRHAVIVAVVATAIVVVIVIAIVSIDVCGSHNNGILASQQDGGRKARVREGFNLDLVARKSPHQQQIYN